jgi:membrane protein
MVSSAESRGRQFASIWKLGGLTVWQLTRNVLHGINEDDLLGRSAELAFNFLLALFPILLLILALFGLFASRSAQLQSSLLSHFSYFLPPAAFVPLSRITIGLAGNATRGKLTFDMVLALWFGSVGISSMMSTLNAAYRVRESRSWFRIRLIALGLTVAISILLFIALFLLIVGENVVAWVGVQVHLRSTFVVLWKGLQSAAAVLFVILLFSIIYNWRPSWGERHWRWVTPGSTFGAILWVAASVGFRVYLHFFNTYTSTYGSFGAVMILLIWLYVTALAFLIGGEINAEIERAPGTYSAQEDPS